MSSEDFTDPFNKSIETVIEKKISNSAVIGNQKLDSTKTELVNRITNILNHLTVLRKSIDKKNGDLDHLIGFVDQMHPGKFARRKPRNMSPPPPTPKQTYLDYPPTLVPSVAVLQMTGGGGGGAKRSRKNNQSKKLNVSDGAKELPARASSDSPKRI